MREKLAQPVDRVSGVDVTDVSAECSNALVSHGTEAIVTGLEKTASERATLMLIGTVLRMPNVLVPQRRTYALTTRITRLPATNFLHPVEATVSELLLVRRTRPTGGDPGHDGPFRWPRREKATLLVRQSLSQSDTTHTSPT